MNPRKLMTITVAVLSLTASDGSIPSVARASANEITALCPILTGVGQNFVISDGVTPQSLFPSVTYNSGENEFMVVWDDLRNKETTGIDVFGQRVSPRGVLIGQNIPLANENGPQVEPSISYNTTENTYFIGWRSQFGGPGSPDFNHAFGRILSHEGVPSGSAFHLSDAGFELSSAYDSTNNRYVVTAREAPGVVYGRTVLHDGSLPGPDVALVTEGSPQNGQVVYNPTLNEYFMTWRDAEAHNLKGQRVSAAGAPMGAPIVVSTIYPDFGTAASIAFDSVNNRYLVVFAEFQESGIFGQFVSGSGAPLGATLRIGTRDSRANPSVVYSATHRAYLVVWVDNRNIVAQKLSEFGQSAGDIFLITQGGTVNQVAMWERPRIVQNTRGGQFLVVWSDSRHLSVGKKEIFGQLVRCGKKGE